MFFRIIPFLNLITL